MSEPYSVLAGFYDRLMEDVDYAAWCDFYVACFAKYVPHPVRSVLDLACGTGSITVPLAARGYAVTGIDLSAEMLTLARKKADEAHVPLVLSEQNIASFDAGGKADAVLCSFDGINYLTAKKDVASCFSRVFDTLLPDGLFVFDVGTEHHFRDTLADHTFPYDYGDLFVSWQSDFCRKSGLCRYTLTFFSEEADGSYTRFDEEQRQRAYPVKTLRALLEEAGFEVLDLVSDLDFSPLTEASERCFFLCRKSGKSGSEQK